jgi:hypothetical protein
MRFALLVALAANLAWGQSPDARSVLQRYLQSGQEQAAGRNEAAREESVQVEIEASLPRLQKRGTMRGVRAITRAGEIVYSRLRFAGDRFVDKDVISRYLATDVQKRVKEQDFTLTASNYRFEPAGERDYNGRAAEVFRVVPKHRRAGLFRGELWLDAVSALPLREWGDFVKSPSRFLGHPRFVRDYSFEENAARPRRLILTAHAAFIGDVEMTIWFTDDAGRDDEDSGVLESSPALSSIAASNP